VVCGFASNKKEPSPIVGIGDLKLVIKNVIMYPEIMTCLVIDLFRRME
jgi:hypothetical protein